MRSFRDVGAVRWCIPAVMDHLRRWRSAGSARRAGVTALAALAVATGLAVLLAVRFHLDLTPVVVVPILIALPGLYMAWAALPRTASKPPYGVPVREWEPVDLGVHQVIHGRPMPFYVCRPHDELLRAVLDPAVPASRLVVVRGGSSTGKTRAAYEAVAARLAGWQLDYPANPAALSARLDAGIPARTVLWLGELRQYADVDGGPAVLGRVADLLHGEGHLLVTTVWPEHWTTYIAAARAGPGPADPAGTAGRLLERLPELTGSDPARIDPARGGVIDVPDQFTAAEMAAAAATSDPVLAEAAAAASGAGQEGQVTQYLAGVPDLLRRYDGPGGDPYGQAIITAAMDATRLGHASPLSAVLLQEASVGYLTAAQRTREIASWRDTALAWAAEELNGAVRALQPVPPVSGTGVAGYQVADYLDQHARRLRQDQLGPPSLWDALTAHAATARDRTRLGQAGRDRGLYRHAAALWTTAAALGSTDAARRLIAFLSQKSPGDSMRAAHWAVRHASLDNPVGAARLLDALREAGAADAVITLAGRAASRASLDNPWSVAVLLDALRAAGAADAVTTLLARGPASRASLDDPGGAARLLDALGEAGAADAVTTLLARGPASRASLDNPGGVAVLLRALRAAGAADAAQSLASRAASRASLEDPVGVEWLLRALREAGAADAVTTLAGRAASRTSLDDPGAVARLLRALRAAGAADAVTTLLARGPASRASLDNPGGVAVLLDALRAAGAADAAQSLASRAASRASLDNPWSVAVLLRALREAGAADAVTTLADRAASRASLDNPWSVAGLLRALREAGAADAVTTLLARGPASRASLDNPGGVAVLLDALREAGAADAVTTLADRAASRASLDNPWSVAGLLDALREAGAADAVTTLADRAASHASLDKPGGVAGLLDALREAGAADAVTTLAGRAASRASLDDRGVVAVLLDALCAAGAADAVTTLASRAADAGMFDLFLAVSPGEASNYPFGREPGRRPSQSWRWREPAIKDRG